MHSRLDTLDPRNSDGRSSKTASVTHVISVDVEDYFQVEAFSDLVSADSWESWPSRVVDNTRRVLDLLEKHDAKGTFFFLGWVARHFPALVREVQSRGHEIACHSYWHQPIYRLTPESFREDTRMACDAIQQASGIKVSGYRAPTWSITNKSLWALEILAEEGFAYDSSIFPIRHDLYGIPDAPRFRHVHSLPSGLRLTEFPPATHRMAGINFPAAGGGYLRLLPIGYTFRALRNHENRDRQPAVVYFHPWEIDPGQPRLQAGLKSRFRHYTNIHLMERRLTALLRSFRFQPFRELLTSAEKQANSLCREPVAQR